MCSTTPPRKNEQVAVACGQCATCFADIEEGVTHISRNFQCGHAHSMCTSCYREWNQSVCNASCPLCRMPFASESPVSAGAAPRKSVIQGLRRRDMAGTADTVATLAF